MVVVTKRTAFIKVKDWIPNYLNSSLCKIIRNKEDGGNIIVPENQIECIYEDANLLSEIN